MKIIYALLILALCVLRSEADGSGNSAVYCNLIKYCSDEQKWNPLKCSCETCPVQVCGYATKWTADRCRCEEC